MVNPSPCAELYMQKKEETVVDFQKEVEKRRRPRGHRISTLAAELNEALKPRGSGRWR